MEHSFSLVPFPDSKIPQIKIAGTIARKKNLLAVHYFLDGKVEDILFPKPVSKPDRRNELWLATCFEFFLSIPGQPQYWEFNLSPSGEWNAFRMDAYRRVGFREERQIPDLQLEIRDAIEGYCVDAVVDIQSIVDSGKQIQAGITAVMQTRHGHETYWALVHPRLQADFHLRESFILALEGTNRL